MERDQPDKELIWEEISTEHIIKDQWIDFRKTSFRYPDGHVYEPFYTYSRRDYAVVVASDREGNYICVRQFRQGIRQVTTEFPAGGIEKGENTALECARRELLEETGYVSDEWKHLLTVPSDATISDNYAHIFTAKKCRKAGKQHLDETERVNVELHSAREIEEMVKAGRFQQAVHALAWLLSKEAGGKE
jgi:ADP-ribose pyrophosphatase